MVKPLVLFLLLIVGTVAWMIWRARRCSSLGCGVVEFEEKPRRNRRGGEKEMTRNTFAVVLIVGTLMGPSVFAGQINTLGQWVPTSTEEGQKGWTATSPTEEAVERGEVSVVAGKRGKVTRTTTRAQAAAVESEPAAWHPALVPFSIGGR